MFLEYDSNSFDYPFPLFTPFLLLQSIVSLIGLIKCANSHINLFGFITLMILPMFVLPIKLAVMHCKSERVYIDGAERMNSHGITHDCIYLASSFFLAKQPASRRIR